MVQHAVWDEGTILRASLVNQDGRSASFAAPNGLAQRSLIQQTLAMLRRRARFSHTVPSFALPNSCVDKCQAP